MRTYYTLDNENKIELFMWDDFFKNDTFRKYAEVTAIYGDKRGRECKKKLFKDENGLYIVWNDKKIYLNEFDYMTVQDLIVAVQTCVDNKDRWRLDDDSICATIMKETDKIGFVLDMPAYDMVIPQMGIGLVGDKEYSVLCIPTEKQYEKDRWFYKFTLECECEELRKFIPSRHFYMSDFCSLLKEGHIKVVERQKFKEEIEQKYAEQEKESRKFSTKIKKFFGKKVECEKLPLVSVR